MNNTPQDSSLGREVAYPAHYDPTLLFPIPRQAARDEIGITADTLPFVGHDRWHGYELSWLDARGKPRVATATLTVPCTSPCLIESKSLKLYLNGYNNERSMALHRVHSAKASTLTFERPDFDLARYDADGRFAIANGERIRLSFVIDKAPGKHLLESRLSEDQTHTETDTNYRITATVVQTLLLDRWLLSFGGQIRDVQKTAVGA